MSFDPSQLLGYSPTLDKIMEDLGITNQVEIRQTLLSKCKTLYDLADKQGNIELYGTSREFIVCNSKDFYKTLVNCGAGNSAMTISDDHTSDVYFLMFDDKSPAKFRTIIAAHESLEYELVSEQGHDIGYAHKKASEKEINTAKKLGLKKEYLAFLKENYPLKVADLKEWNFI